MMGTVVPIHYSGACVMFSPFWVVVEQRADGLSLQHNNETGNWAVVPDGMLPEHACTVHGTEARCYTVFIRTEKHGDPCDTSSHKEIYHV